MFNKRCNDSIYHEVLLVLRKKAIPGWIGMGGEEGGNRMIRYVTDDDGVGFFEKSCLPKFAFVTPITGCGQIRSICIIQIRVEKGREWVKIKKFPRLSYKGMNLTGWVSHE